MTWLSLKSTIFVVSLYLSQVSKILFMPNTWKRENQFMALDKKSDDTRFGSRSYTFLDWVTTEKGIGSEKTFFGKSWPSSRILDVSGMIPDVSGMSGTIKTERTPLAQTSLSRSNQPSRHLLPHLGRPRISPTKEREGDRIREGLHQDWRPGDLISHRLLISSPKVP